MTYHNQNFNANGDTNFSTTPPKKTYIMRTKAEMKAVPPPKWLIKGLLMEDTLAVIYGPSGSFKSFVTLGMGLAIAHGVSWNNINIEKGAVCYVASEGEAGVGKRITAWEIENGITAEENHFNTITDTVNLLDNGDVDALVEAIAAKQDQSGINFSLVVLDTLARSMVGADENSATDMGKAVDSADKIRRAFGCTVVLVHHTGKSLTSGARGSSALRGAADTMIEVVRAEGQINLSLKLTKQKDEEEGKGPTYLAKKIDLPWSSERGYSSSLVVALDSEAEKPSLSATAAALIERDRMAIAETIMSGTSMTSRKLVGGDGCGIPNSPAGYARIEAAVPYTPEWVKVETAVDGTRWLTKTLSPSTPYAPNQKPSVKCVDIDPTI